MRAGRKYIDPKIITSEFVMGPLAEIDDDFAKRLNLRYIGSSRGMDIQTVGENLRNAVYSKEKSEKYNVKFIIPSLNIDDILNDLEANNIVGFSSRSELEHILAEAALRHLPKSHIEKILAEEYAKKINS